MKKYVIDGYEIWIGVHADRGILIYDPAAQLKRDDGFVRLFKTEQQKTGIFDKELMRDQLRSTLSADVSDIEAIASAYVQARTGRSRSANCYKCRRKIDSVNFSICGHCNWIECQCGACGCDYKGHPNY